MKILYFKLIHSKKEGVEVFYAQCDIREMESVETFVKKVLERFSRIDGLVNNAGGQFPVASENLNSKG
jgi:citronellol/citronellal dehydrogenase